MAIKGVPRRKTVIEILMERKPIEVSRIEQAEAEANVSNKTIQTVLVEKGFITKEALLDILKDEWKVEIADIAAMKIDPDVVKIVPESVARRSLALPFEKGEKVLSVAIANPLDMFIVEDLATRTGLEIKPFLAMPRDIIAGIDAVYGKREPADHEERRYPDIEIKYGLPDAPRKHLLVLKGGAMEICESQEAATARVNSLGADSVEEVWEMKKRTIVRRQG